MNCPGLHCPGCGGGDLVKAVAGLAVAGLVIWWLITIIWVIAAIVGVVLAAVLVPALVWLARRGADVAVVARTPPEATPIQSRPAQALTGPQQLHIHFHGLDGAQAAEAIRAQAITERTRP